MQSFQCKFADDVTCTVTAPDEPPDSGKEIPRRKVEWSGAGRLKPSMFRAYVGWMNSVNQTLANRWKLTLMHVYLVDESDPEEVWVFKPGETPKRVASKR